jgi:hypothetical protein
VLIQFSLKQLPCTKSMTSSKPSQMVDSTLSLTPSMVHTAHTQLLESKAILRVSTQYTQTQPQVATKDLLRAAPSNQRESSVSHTEPLSSTHQPTTLDGNVTSFSNSGFKAPLSFGHRATTASLPSQATTTTMAASAQMPLSITLVFRPAPT